MSLYTPQIKKIVKTSKAPYSGFIFDVLEHDTYLELLVYRDNVESFSDPQKLALAEWLYRLKDEIEATGTKCFLGGSEGVPKRLPRK